MIKFYDTNALLQSFNTVTNQRFILSNLTFKELESIKNNPNKDLETKYRARLLINQLIQYEQQYDIIKYNSEWDNQLQRISILNNNTDSRIIISALKAKEKYPDLEFVTNDLNCYCLAKELKLNVKYPTIKKDLYTGYKQIICNTDEELVNFYSNLNKADENLYNLLINQYALVEDKNHNILSIHKFTGNQYKDVPEMTFNSRMFGKIKPKDEYQKIVIDSMLYNQITVIRGKAGTGKSLLSLGCLFEKLEKNKIDKIIIFCNTVATDGSAKLGYYPGSKDEKLLDSQIGNFLSSKLGDKIAVQTLIDKGQLLLLPMSDIRGFDTSGMRAGIYITEAQNMNIDLMKLALQRVGEDSIVILDGDDNAQVDLNTYSGSNNGLKRVSKVFRGESIYGETTLKNIYRSKIANIAERM